MANEIAPVYPMFIRDAGHNWHSDIANAWTPENRYTNVPRIDAMDEYTNASSDRWLISSDYLSINNITLGYTVPKQRNVYTMTGLWAVRSETTILGAVGEAEEQFQWIEGWPGE